MCGMKLPDNSKYQEVNDVNECGQWCLNNCSCKAYAYVMGIGCLLWSEDLIDMQEFSSGGEELFIRLASSELGDNIIGLSNIFKMNLVSFSLLFFSLQND
ncbi:hypothetical protein SLE2022_391770 [Rubroshorea leprosula]